MCDANNSESMRHVTKQVPSLLAPGKTVKAFDVGQEISEWYTCVAAIIFKLF